MKVIDAAQRVEPDLDEDRGRLLDVLARRLDQARRLPQLRQDAAGAFLLGRVVENGLRREARGQRLGVELRIALPGPDVLELELASADVRRDNGVLDLLDLGQAVRRGIASRRREKPASALRCLSMAGRRKSSSRSSCLCTPSIVALARVRLVEVVQVVVDEMRKWFSSVHSVIASHRERSPGCHCRLIRQWR